MQVVEEEEIMVVLSHLQVDLVLVVVVLLDLQTQMAVLQEML
tara:strand:+ start:387 stop:512 length:126 start_codon:yes stop_codon:yes gene_type:complete